MYPNMASADANVNCQVEQQRDGMPNRAKAHPRSRHAGLWLAVSDYFSLSLSSHPCRRRWPSVFFSIASSLS
jgi:hypothetical protein